MPLTLGWENIAARLALAVIAGALIGWNRGVTGHHAGMRTMLLVCFAAAASSRSVWSGRRLAMRC